MRYKDEIQCAGAELVAAVRQDAIALRKSQSLIQNSSKDEELSGDYYALHIRRGDFQYKVIYSLYFIAFILNKSWSCSGSR